MGRHFSKTGFPRSLERLRRDFAAPFGLAALLETPPAALFERVYPIDEETESRLSDLLNALTGQGFHKAQYVLANKALFAAECAPRFLCALHRHDGLGPIPVARIAPANQTQYDRAEQLIQTHGFTSRLMDGPTPPPVIALDRAFAHHAHIIDPSTGLAFFEPACDWSGLALCASSAGLALPQFALRDRFPTPCAAAEAGLFEMAQQQTQEDQPGYHIRLPQRGARLAQGLWMFRHEASAREAFQRLARKYRPTFIEFIPKTDLDIATATGLTPGPAFWQGRKWGGAVRIAMLGAHGQASVALSQITWDIEWAGGIKLDIVYAPRAMDREKALLWSAMGEITQKLTVSWSDVGTATSDLFKKITDRAHQAAQTLALLRRGEALITTRLTACHGLAPRAEMSLIYPRSGARTDLEWQHLRANWGDQTAPYHKATPTSAEEVEASDEWQAIRAALLRQRPDHAA